MKNVKFHARNFLYYNIVEAFMVAEFALNVECLAVPS